MNATLLQPLISTTLRAVLASCGGPCLPSRFEKAQQPNPPQACNWACAVKRGLHWWKRSAAGRARGMLGDSIPLPAGPGQAPWPSKLQHGLAGLALGGMSRPAGAGW